VEDRERLGLRLAAEGRADLSIELLAEAAEANPADAARHYNLAAALCAAGRWADAVESVRRSLRTDATLRPALVLLAWALLEAGEPEQALAASEAALPLAAEWVLLRVTRGRIFALAGEMDRAGEEFSRALALDPRNRRALQAAVGFYRDAGEDSLCLEALERLAELDPDAVPVLRQLAGAAMRVGDLPLALRAQREAIALGADDPALLSAHLHTLLYDPAETTGSLRAAHGRLFRGTPGGGRIADDPERPLCIGVLSGEIDGGSAAHFLAPVLRLPGLVIDAERPDVLLDISGHLPRNHYARAAGRLAPVQIAYPRYPCETGCAAIDFRIADRWTEPTPGPDVLSMPNGYLGYTPPYAPPIVPLPALRNGYVTFGYFAGPLRLTEPLLDQIAAILRAVASSRLLIHYAVPDFDRPGRLARRRIEEAFARRGVAGGRLRFAGPMTLERHLLLLAECDIALDSYPYSGQTNTCEVLWMGVPVVTQTGERFSSRVSASILHRCGLSEWVGGDYVGIAVEAARDIARLARLRAELRERMAASTLLNIDQVSRELEAAIRTAWRRSISQL